MERKKFYVYILTNKGNRVLYTGVTSNLTRRTYEHKEKLVSGFTKKYQVSKLIYYEEFDSPADAIAREKQIKGGSRLKKLALINAVNPDRNDLFEQLI